MKKVLCVAILAALTLSCKEQANTYTIQGSLADTTGTNGKMVFLTNQSNWQCIDTCVIKDGKFSFTGNIDSLAFLVVQHEDFYVEYIPENGITRIILSEDNSVVSGTPLNETLYTYLHECDSSYVKTSQKIKEVKADSTLNDESKETKAGVLWKEFTTELHTIRESYLKTNSHNNIGLHILGEMVSEEKITNVAQLDSLLNLIDPRISKFEGLQWSRDRMIGAEATQVGSSFVDFNGFLPNGTEVKLSDFVGKGNYVLVDFWSVGCPPCVDELPVLKEVYAKYKEKGFLLIGINDRNRKQDIEATMQEFDMSWPQICTYGDDTSTAKYGVSGVPFIFLFTPDGKIAARDIRGEEITEKLAEVYSNKI